MDGQCCPVCEAEYDCMGNCACSGLPPEERIMAKVSLEDRIMAKVSLALDKHENNVLSKAIELLEEDRKGWAMQAHLEGDVFAEGCANGLAGGIEKLKKLRGF